MNGPLSGFTVLDLTRVLSGPYCTMVLGDLGARIIKVEHPGKGDDTRHWGPPFVGKESAYFLSINRNKESVTVDFKPAEGREVLERLMARADVFVRHHLLFVLRGGARAPGSGPEVPRLGRAVYGQLLRDAELGGVQ
jgi:formyl-CoA transferase/CoA:oxalate CoA-transferase